MIGTIRPCDRARKRALVPRLVALEDRTVLTTLIVNPALPLSPTVFHTIQAAVNAAASAGGDTIQIAPATYPEQVTINKSLTMQGTGPGVEVITARQQEKPLAVPENGEEITVVPLPFENFSFDPRRCLSRRRHDDDDAEGVLEPAANLPGER